MGERQWWRLGAVQIAAAVRAGETSAAAVLESHLQRLDTANPALNAVVVDLRDQARREAAAADARQAQGELLPPLHGVPILTKINSDQAGAATSDGLPAFADNVAEADSPQIGNLRRAGAIVFGRTNAPEFSMRWHTENPLFGRTGNPWDDAVTPGGSSGGSSAAVAAGIASLAHGNDIGGSLRYPAYCTGLASLKPTVGVIPEYCATHGGAEWPPAVKILHCQGVIGRQMADLEVAFDVMTRQDIRDPWWSPTLAADGEASKPAMAVCADPGGFGVDPSVAEAVRRAAEAFAAAGHAVEWVPDLPRVADACKIWGNLLCTEMEMLWAQAIETYGTEDIRRHTRFLIEAGGPTDFAGYLQAFAERTAVMRAWDLFLERYPLVLTTVSSERPLALRDEPRTLERMRTFLLAQRMLLVPNVTGLPGLAMPVMVYGGLPLGVQLIGRRHHDRQVLRAGAVLERATGFTVEALWRGALAGQLQGR